MSGTVLSAIPAILMVARPLLPAVRLFIAGALERDEEKMKLAQVEAMIAAKYVAIRRVRDGSSNS